MKGTRLIVFILSLLLLTMSSGLLFYKNLFMLESPVTGGKVDFEELRYSDLQINATTANLRKNLSLDASGLDAEIKRLSELMNIVTDVNKGSIELGQSIIKIQQYFETKLINLKKFQQSLEQLKQSVGQINGAYNDLVKNNIKFSVDKRDFYRECVVDALFYLSLSNKDNRARLEEDQKILGQILSFATAPNPLILNFSKHIDVIHRTTGELDALSEKFTNDASINKEMLVVGKYYREAQEARSRDGEIFLMMVFGAIVLYLISVVVILRKMS